MTIELDHYQTETSVRGQQKIQSCTKDFHSTQINFEYAGQVKGKLGAILRSNMNFLMGLLRSLFDY